MASDREERRWLGMGVRRLIAALGVGTVGIALAAMMAPQAAVAAPGLPTGLSVTRPPTDAHKIRVAWKPVKGADHYTVTLSDGTTEAVHVLPANVNLFTLDAPSN